MKSRPCCPWACPLPTLAVSDGWQHWPSLPDLVPDVLPWVKPAATVSWLTLTLNRLQRRVADYFNAISATTKSPAAIRQ